MPYRARRIYDLLSAHPKLSADDFRRVQGDVYSIGNVTFARAAAKTLKSASVPGAITTGSVSVPGAVATGSGEQMAKLIADLETWDGLLVADSHLAAIVSQMRNAFRQRIFNAALGPDLAKSYSWSQSDVLIDRLVTEQP